MGRADVVVASMLPVTSEAFGGVRMLRPAVSRDAAGIHMSQAGNRFHRFAISARSPDAATGDASFGRRDRRAPQLSPDASWTERVKVHAP